MVSEKRESKQYVINKETFSQKILDKNLTQYMDFKL